MPTEGPGFFGLSSTAQNTHICTEDLHAGQFICPSAGTIDRVKLYISNWGGVEQTIAMFYHSSAGSISFLCSSQPLTNGDPGVADGWCTFTVNGSPSVEAGGIYYIGAYSNGTRIGGTNTNYSVAKAGVGGVWDEDMTWGSKEDPVVWDTFSASDSILAWVEYTESAASESTPVQEVTFIGDRTMTITGTNRTMTIS